MMVVQVTVKSLEITVNPLLLHLSQELVVAEMLMVELMVATNLFVVMHCNLVGMENLAFVDSGEIHRRVQRLEEVEWEMTDALAKHLELELEVINRYTGVDDEQMLSVISSSLVDSRS
jgi:hypothetical protein